MERIRALTAQPLFWPWVLLVGLSAVLHLYLLDVRPFHSDEAIHAVLSLQFARSGEYQYDPTYHGPLLYYLTALVYWLFGDSDFTARLPAALCGVALTGLCAGLSRWFDARTAWWTGLLVTISPLFLYYGRFLRMDILEVLLATLAVFAFHDAVTTGRFRAWAWFGTWTALAFATKENAWVTAGLAAITALALWLYRGGRWDLGAVSDWVRHNRAGITGACSLWVIVCILAYTVFFSRPGDWFFPVKAIGHWAEQHRIERVAGPWWYHLMRLAQYEFLVIGCALVRVIGPGRLTTPEFCLLTFGILSVAAYACLGEKTPWLGTHQVWAFLPLAGAQLARTFGPAGSLPGRSLAATGIAATVLVSITASFTLAGMSPRERRVESLQYAETTIELRDFAASVAGRPPPGRIAVQGNAIWPLAWYWRNMNVRWSLPGEAEITLYDLVLADPGRAMAPRKSGQWSDRLEMIPVRGWWQPEHAAPDFTGLVRYMLFREPWLPPIYVSTTAHRPVEG